jgi:type VI secretion system protein ImpC
VRLVFRELRDFRPERVAESVPELRGLLAVRHVLEHLVNEPVELESLAERLVAEGADPTWASSFQRALLETKGRPQAEGTAPPTTRPPAPREGDSKDPLAGLMSMVEMPGEGQAPAPAPAGDPFERLLRAIAGASGRQRGLEKALAGEVMAESDRALGEQLATILHHPEFLALESAWRSLKLLVDRTDFRQGIELEVLHARKEDLVELIEEHLVRPEQESPRDPPLAAIWIDHEFDATARDVESLTALAVLAEQVQAPLVAAVGPAFFGVELAQEVNRLSPVWDHLKRPEYIPFASLSRQECSQFVSLVFPRVLTRMPYGPEGDPVKGFAWHEQDPDELPWGHGVAAVASRVAASHAESGWPTAFTGPQGGGIVENLPIAPLVLDGDSVRLPVDARLSESMLDELADGGFVVLAARANDDRAFVAGAPSIHRAAPHESPDAAWTARREASLPFRLLAAQVMGALRRVAARSPGGPPDAVRAHFEQALAAALGLAPREERVSVAVEPDAEAPGRLGVGVHLRLPVVVMGEEVEMDLALTLGR